MKEIFLDSEFKCHLYNDGTMITIKTDIFDGMCDKFIEGHRFVPNGETWTRYDGEIFHGQMVAPWENYAELDAAQRTHEKRLLEDYETNLAELDALVLSLQYNNLIGDL